MNCWVITCLYGICKRTDAVPATNVQARIEPVNTKRKTVRGFIINSVWFTNLMNLRNSKIILAPDTYVFDVSNKKGIDWPAECDNE